MESQPLLDKKPQAVGFEGKTEVSEVAVNAGDIYNESKTKEGKRGLRRKGVDDGNTKRGWLPNAYYAAAGFAVGMLLTICITNNILPYTSLSKRQASALYDGPTIVAAGSSRDFVPNSVSSEWRCLPPPPPFLLDDPRVAQSPAVKLALAQIELILKSYAFTSKDAISISIVHSSKGKIYDFHSGRKRLNESAYVSPAPVDGNSIYRIASISKVFAVLETLLMGRQARVKGFAPELTLESRLQDLLPEFELPSEFEDEAADITLAQLGSHRAGIGRDVGELVLNSLNDITWPPVPGKETFIERYYSHNTTPQELLRTISKNDLIWQVGQTPSYSNTGFSLMGLTIERYRVKLKKQSSKFKDIVKDDIFDPLRMYHTFAGPIPQGLRQDIVAPKARNFVDRIIPAVHDAAGGIFSTTNDLSKLLYRVLLSRNPLLISPSQRLNWLRSIHYNTDAITSVGIPWEVYRAIMPDYAAYGIYFKGGGLPGQYSQLSAFPEFGYGIVVLTSAGSSDQELLDGATTTDPLALSFRIHNTIAPAIWKAYNDILVADYVGTYRSADGAARIAFENGALVLKELRLQGVDVLLKGDQLFWWAGGAQYRIFEAGAKLIGTGLEGKFRAAPLYTCVWSAFDMVTTKSGWGLDLIVIKKVDGKMTLFYEPIKATLVKQ